jgi:hypothetical protein
MRQVQSDKCEVPSSNRSNGTRALSSSLKTRPCPLLDQNPNWLLTVGASSVFHRLSPNGNWIYD